MGKRFAILIGSAAAGVMALGAQTAAATPVHKYDTELTITHEGHVGTRGVIWHGGVISEVGKCMEGRRVVLYKQRPGADRNLGATASDSRPGNWGDWWETSPARHRVYAKVKREQHHRYVCRADRSPTDST
jgi:hypothetical protein